MAAIEQRAGRRRPPVLCNLHRGRSNRAPSRCREWRYLRVVRIHLRLPLSALAALAASGWAGADARAQQLESLWYLRGEQSIQSFLTHADQISIVAPQVFTMDSTGRIRGQVDPRVIETARAKGVKLIPLVMNPGFDQPTMHRVLNHRVGARAGASGRSPSSAATTSSTAFSSTSRTSTSATGTRSRRSLVRRSIRCIAPAASSPPPWCRGWAMIRARTATTAGSTTTGAARSTTRRSPTRSTSSRT